MSIALIIFLGLFIAGLILGIVTMRVLKKGPSIEIIQGKLDNGCGDDITEAVKHLKIVNRDNI